MIKVQRGQYKRLDTKTTFFNFVKDQNFNQ